ncbi:MAG TPA: D-glycero-beta-D-manno-heptose 1,7-bisphosphate 7-phosphatase [Longilinea sp.]|nr:D-glycero-beta-D-manno-heptose 1,7-bisphosphate 7-phosphatase [Longilinea sp.]
MDPAIFLDRDGVIIENREDYVRSWSDVEFIPAALEALRNYRSSPFRIVLVTNQSAVGRGLITLKQAQKLNQRITMVVEQAGGRVDGTWMCPHAPHENCACRKPQPGLLLQAATALSLDLSRSYMIGDALSDLKAGRAAGVREAMLVRTGRGSWQASLPEAALLQPFRIFDSLAEALNQISSQLNQ